MLDVCAVVRQADEATLAAISGDADCRAAFHELSRVSAIEPARHGLMLHDDVRRVLADELRWRHAERYRALRLRALDYFTDRMRGADAEEREWLLTERLALWGDALVQQILFAPEEQGEFW